MSDARTVAEAREEFRSGATFSGDRAYRYLLWRRWSSGAPATFIMLNPSTADEHVNDPTVERCERRARAIGAGGVIVANLFALRSTDPRSLYSATDPIGSDNDRAILTACHGAAPVICAWGKHGHLHGRGAAVLSMLWRHDILPWCLGTNKDGTPKHPLYQPYAAELVRLA